MQLPDWLHQVAATLPSPFTGKLELSCVEDGVAEVNVIVNQKFRPPRKITLDKYHKFVVSVRQHP